MSSDEQQNLPAVPEQPKVHTLELPVAEFEGEMVRVMLGKIPALNLEMEYGYARGTHLKLELEVRCRSVRVDETTSGPNKGELFREHIFALEEAKIIGVYAAEELDPGVGGGLAGPGPEDEDSDDRPEPEGDQDGPAGPEHPVASGSGFPDF